MTCSSSIVECLKTNGINPVPSSYSGTASKALIYDSNFFDGREWWKIDFTRAVSLSKYQIHTYSGCHYLKKWDAYVSKDNKNWTKVDSQTGFAAGRVFPIKPVNARYFKIIGNDGDCGGNFLFFDWIKFFGSLKPIPESTFNQKKFIYLRILILTFIIRFS